MTITLTLEPSPFVRRVGSGGQSCRWRSLRKVERAGSRGIDVAPSYAAVRQWNSCEITSWSM
jgi:hypothetical protein